MLAKVLWHWSISLPSNNFWTSSTLSNSISEQLICFHGNFEGVGYKAGWVYLGRPVRPPVVLVSKNISCIDIISDIKGYHQLISKYIVSFRKNTSATPLYIYSVTFENAPYQMYPLKTKKNFHVFCFASPQQNRKWNEYWK